MFTGIVYSEKYLEHELGHNHPESPDRLRAIVEALKEKDLWNNSEVKLIGPRPCTEKDLELSHTTAHINSVRKNSEEEMMMDFDTPTHKNTFEIALLSTGGTIDAFESVINNDVRNSYALVRPPGHHATANSAGGFCYFNNIAVSVEKMINDDKIDHAMIIDFDAHHGNGTQDIFYEDPNVLYISLHQSGRTLYPGTGFVNEVGVNEGEGYNVNIPLPPGSSDNEYSSAMNEIFTPLTEQFKPQLIAVSAGFDAHEYDPLTRLNLSSSAYGWMTKMILDQSEKVCDGQIVFVLEGGYNQNALADANIEVLNNLSGRKNSTTPPACEHMSQSVEEVKIKLADYWEL